MFTTILGAIGCLALSAIVAYGLIFVFEILQRDLRAMNEDIYKR